MVDITEHDSPDIAHAIKAINVEDKMSEFTDKIYEAKRINYINPLMDAVSSL